MIDLNAMTDPIYTDIHPITTGDLFVEGDMKANEIELRVYWHEHGWEMQPSDGHMRGYDIHFVGPCLSLLNIVTEVSRAVSWFKGLGALNNGEDNFPFAAVTAGVWTEEILAALMRMGWYYGCKINRGAVFNRDLLLAIHAPGTPDICLAGTPIEIPS